MSINDGLALIRQHKFQEALEPLATEARARPDDPYAAYYLAYAFVGAGELKPAITLLERLLEAHPQMVEARNLLGLAKIRSSDFTAAASAYQLVLQKDPENASALLGLGMIFYWRRETAVAEDYLDRALRKHPGLREALVFKADIAYSQGKIGAAVALLEDARRAKASPLPEVSEMEIDERLRRYQAALAPLRASRSGLPNFPGWVMAVIGVTLALVVLSAAQLPAAATALSHYRSGQARLEAMDYPGCADEMVAAVSVAPDSSKAWAYEAYCYLLDHDNSAGLSAWATARSLDPTVTLDKQSDQLAFEAKLTAAARPPRGGQK